MIRVIAVVAVLVGIGCAGSVEWKKPYGSDFKRDNYDCMQDARESNPEAVYKATEYKHLTMPARRVYKSCMESKGYEEKK